MLILAAAVVIVGLLGLLNLLLTVGLIRRVREHGEQLAQAVAGGVREGAMAVGSQVPPFEAVSTRGEPITLDAADGTVVGFFSTTCEPCEQLLPEFVAYAASLPGGRSRVVAVVVGEEGPGTVKAAALSEVARVVAEPHTGPLTAAFRTSTFPTVYVVAPDGQVVVSGHSMGVLGRPVPVGAAG